MHRIISRMRDQHDSPNSVDAEEEHSRSTINEPLLSPDTGTAFNHPSILSLNLSPPDHLNTTLGEPDLGPSYKISTPRTLLQSRSSDVTTVQRAGVSAAVARIEWHYYEQLSTKIVGTDGTGVSLGDWLARAIASGSSGDGFSRTFTLKDEAYTWTWHADHLQLVDAAGSPVARDVRSKDGLKNPATHPFRLDVHPSGADMLDSVVVSWVCMQQLRRQHNSTVLNMSTS